MYLATVTHQGRDRLAGRLAPQDPWRLAPPSVSLAEVIGGTLPWSWNQLPTGADLVPVLPYRPGALYGVGMNYRDAIEERGGERPAEPRLFPKLSSSVIGSGEAVVIDPELTQRVDWETELAVVIGTEARQVSETDALRYVFGYTVANDISARDLQERDGQWLRGKGLDTFCPFGPVLVTADEIPDPQRLRIRTRVNGETVQDGSTADMVFGVPALIAYLSRFFTLRPGDVVLTGTPAGCGDFMRPRRGLRPGDLLESEVEGIGRLANPVRSSVRDGAGGRVTVPQEPGGK
ncbi:MULTISPECIES: fumarylacetoacetate hydrolase family protein [Streptomyces]|uniref:Fumarylacetoacetate hydrolase family protein n=1 Tax=Streptomyces nigrescens TaxID=1920 RepID=A0ABY7JBL0_STRNI|nr:MULTISPECIES: fumarylacetoacetate hydrolase family protein [Streptomyces]MCX5445392.1 fumarylacetoacetate hydrolase family protein [Streptomyces libani]MYT14671.1 FAA hydrolase family protein [Streptomyces sp. SID4951]WAU08731.1 fumarylacetoacetate hydrolase family protein [Streptomyces nigrescens]SCK15667.1 5-carboxymethyl-2-hydroxymuconate isomerase [Streptomyces sp. SceaMP-e96]